MQEQKYSIKSWAKDDQPREKLRSKGPQFLTDSELVAILIGKGTPKRNAVDLARDVLNLGHNNLAELGKLPVTDLTKISGVGLTKAILISAALEIGRRRVASTAIDKLTVNGSILNRCFATWVMKCSVLFILIRPTASNTMK
jgi:DNA repair protein RadC